MRWIAALLLMTAAANAEPPRVITDIPVIHSLTAQVMEGLPAPDVLIDQPADPHEFQLRPSQAQRLARADLVIAVSDQLTPWLPRVLETLSDAPEAVWLLEQPETIRRMAADQNGSDIEDPHAWLDPDNAKLWLSVIADALARQDPHNAGIYRRNAQNSIARIDELTTEIAGVLGPVGASPILVLHDAYTHFAARFGIPIAGSIRAVDATPPSAARIVELRKQIGRDGVRCVFAEPQLNDAVARSLAGDLGLRLATLDPTGVSENPGVGLYGAVMRNMARTIADCDAETN